MLDRQGKPNRHRKLTNLERSRSEGNIIRALKMPVIAVRITAGIFDVLQWYIDCRPKQQKGG